MGVRIQISLKMYEMVDSLKMSAIRDIQSELDAAVTECLDWNSTSMHIVGRLSLKNLTIPRLSWKKKDVLIEEGIFRISKLPAAGD